MATEKKQRSSRRVRTTDAPPPRPRRVEGWEARLRSVVERHRTIEFSWEHSNCGHLMIDVGEAMTLSAQPYEKYVTGIRSDKDAARKIVKSGHSSLGDLLASLLEEVPVNFARRGDLCTVLYQGEEAGGAVIGDNVICKSETGGLIWLDRSLVRRAFRI